MPIVVTDLGSASDTTGANTVSVTVPGGGVPAGALIVIAVQDASQEAWPAGSASDTAGNTYVSPVGGNPNNGTNHGLTQVFYAFNVTALSSGNTISYTKGFHAFDACISVLYATGIDTTSPLDSAVTASAFAFSGSPSVTSGTPSVAGELLVAGLGADIVSGNSFTQDTTNGWATPPDNVVVAGSTQAAGGNQVVAGTTAKTFAPTIFGNAWFAWVIGFKPAGGGGGGTPNLRTMMGVGT